MNDDIGLCHVEIKNIDTFSRVDYWSHRSLQGHLNQVVMWLEERLHHIAEEEVEMTSQATMASIIDSVIHILIIKMHVGWNSTYLEEYWLSTQ